ncbi:hypothetical protein FNO01nite_26020 [Flavobacterium noncentrifugens]|uniref:Phage envelope protein n=1 Tax=Flavobacterium noncentrifugens TaxID=1128970 RepID=A0A1G8ZHC0_9FLAO|nr:DUF1398 family protein [Flavobacterium noncentrifugens]GEP51930.1 hypothetical protein FNO01nite_26020 [Flavobacterium noncentrifugens]SDK14489.1 Protein of unknown function [Flavobacterium noncentrifugens]
MFTVEQIKQAHSKVKSGADFSSYVQEIKVFGVNSYELYVTDGHTDYFGANSYKTSADAEYAALIILDTANASQFISDLKAHQQGKTTYIARFGNRFA